MDRKKLLEWRDELSGISNIIDQVVYFGNEQDMFDVVSVSSTLKTIVTEMGDLLIRNKWEVINLN